MCKPPGPLAIVLLFIVLLVAPGSAVAQGTISGTVTNATTTLPVAQMEVDFYTSAGTYATNAYTNEQGVYFLPGLPTGSYFVVALPSFASGLVGQLYSNIPCPDGHCLVTSGTAVTVTANTTSIINFALQPGGRIRGRVTDATTTLPVINMEVDFYSSTGGFASGYAGYGTTDSQGIYASPPLPSGSYFVLAHSTPRLVGQLYNNIPCPSGICSLTSGTAVPVTAPNATSNINFALRPGGTISGRVTNATTTQPVANVGVSFYTSTGEATVSTSTNAQGFYTSPALPTGSYFAVTFPTFAPDLVGQLYSDIPCPNGTCSVTSGTAVPVTAPNATSNINFALQPGATITGTVTNVTTTLPVASVLVSFYTSSGSSVGSAVTDAQGVYTSPGLPTGSYFARTSAPLATGLIDELFDNISCPGAYCSVTSGTAVPVTLPNQTSNINFALAQAPSAPNDTFAAGMVINSTPFHSILNTNAATTSGEDPAVTCTDRSTQRSVWYLFTPAIDGPVVVNTFGSNYDTILSIYTGSPGSFTSVGCNNDSRGHQSSLAVHGVAGQRLSILVSSYGSAGGVLGLNVTAGTPFTDDVLIAGSSLIRSVHRTELRARIDALRVRYGLSVFSWTDSALVAGMPISVVHLTELRTALQQAFAAAGWGAWSFTDATVVSGTTLIRMVHIKELRDAVLSLEGG